MIEYGHGHNQNWEFVLEEQAATTKCASHGLVTTTFLLICKDNIFILKFKCATTSFDTAFYQPKKMRKSYNRK